MLKSNFSLNLSYNLDNTAKEYLFKPIISKFLYCQTGIIEDFEILQAETYISSYDFKNSQITSMEYVYLNFVNEISRTKGNLDIPINIFITFDKRQCPNYCHDSDRYFSSIKIGGISKVYYILFCTDEIFDFLYSNETNCVEEIKSLTASDSFDSEKYYNKNEIMSSNKYVRGYLDNHNTDKGLSFVSFSNDSGYPIYHRDFPEIIEIKIGSILDLEINDANKFGKVVGYNLLEDKEIEGLIQFFDGIFQKRGFNGYIITDLDMVKTIFVPSVIAKDFESDIDVKVSCLARNKKPIGENQYEWIALQVVERK